MSKNKPIAACNSSTCRDCPTLNSIHCHFIFTDWLVFLAISLPAFVFAGLGLYLVSGPWLGVWLLILVAFFWFIEVRVLCSHCPHYAEPGLFLTCWANFGSPKIWKYRPGPMSMAEKIVQLGGFVVVWGFPAFFLGRDGLYIWLAVYLAATAGFFIILKLSFCAKCMNLTCPLNGVSREDRAIFPVVQQSAEPDKDQKP